MQKINHKKAVFRRKHVDVRHTLNICAFSTLLLWIKSPRVSLLSKLFSRKYLHITELKRRNNHKTEKEHNFCKKVMLNCISLLLWNIWCDTWVADFRLFAFFQLEYDQNVLHSFLHGYINSGSFTILPYVSLKAYGWLMGWLTKVIASKVFKVQTQQSFRQLLSMCCL